MATLACAAPAFWKLIRPAPPPANASAINPPITPSGFGNGRLAFVLTKSGWTSGVSGRTAGGSARTGGTGGGATGSEIWSATGRFVTAGVWSLSWRGPGIWTGGKPGGNRIASARATIAGGAGEVTAGTEGATTDGGVCPLAPEPGVGVGKLGVGKLQIRCKYEPHGCEGPGPTQPEMVQLKFALVVREPDTVEDVVRLVVVELEVVLDVELEDVELDPECELQNECGVGLVCGPDDVLDPGLVPELPPDECGEPGLEPPLIPAGPLPAPEVVVEPLPDADGP